MSRGDGRALHKAAERLDRDFELWPSPHYLPNFPKRPLGRDMLAQIAESAIDAYLDALLSELPEEAVDAMEDAYLESDCPHDAAEEFRIAARAFLLSLRSSSRGANG